MLTVDPSSVTYHGPLPQSAFSFGKVVGSHRRIPDDRLGDDVRLCEVFGCRPHEGGAAHTGAGVRKPPMEETAGGADRSGVRRYGDFVAGGPLPRCVDRLFGKRSKGWRARLADRDRQNRRRTAEIDRQGGCPGRRDGEQGRCRSRAGAAEVQFWNVAANPI
jgi:hypothetical protein